MSEKEVWKDVAGYEGIYQISSLGRLKNIRRHRMMNPSINGSGYVVASLSKDGKCSMVRVHRLVAKAFLPQKHSDLRLVNHKDGNKTNNVVHNLEWVTPKINSVHALETGLINNDVVVQLGADGIILGFYHSAREASKKTGIDSSAISKVIKHSPDHPKAGGYVWVKGSEMCGRKLGEDE